MLNVNEIFTSIQGEGIQMGMPTTFIRLAGCNLKCVWCDTKYALEGKKRSEKEIVELVKVEPNVSNICITGGEPLVQELSKLVRELHRRLMTKYITIETNGTIMPSFYLLHAIDFWSVSPKLSNSGMEEHLNKDVIYELGLRSNCQLKFVIEKQKDIDEVFDLLEDLHLYKAQVILQPQGYRNIPKTLRMMRDYVLRKYPNKVVRVLPQLHVIMYRHKRGV